MFKTCKKPPMSIISVSGDVCSFKALQEGLPLKSHVVQLAATQSGSGTPSLDNVRTINGWGAIHIGQVQKNFIKEEISVNNRYILANGTTAYNGTWGIVNVPIVGGQVYSISGINYPDTGTYFAWYDANNTLISVLGNHKNYTNITAPSNACYLGMSFLMSPSNTRYDLNTAQVELGSSATSFEAYNGTYTTIQIGSTVYGGYYDARTGVLTVTHEIVDLGSFTNWGYTSSGNRFTSGYVANEIKLPATDSTVADIIADIFDTKSLTTLRSSADDNLIAVGDSGVISIRCTTYGTDANAFKTAMSGHYIVYELATPTTIQLPPCPIDIRFGLNNIFADCGSTTLEAIKIGR